MPTTPSARLIIPLDKENLKFVRDEARRLRVTTETLIVAIITDARLEAEEKP
jgi:hypothetical protein